MSKIKSTLDIVMERTKNMQMSEEEKQVLHRKEGSAKVDGWIQKYFNGKMYLRELKIQLEAEENIHPELRKIFKNELINRIEPEGENNIIFQALTEVLGTDSEQYALKIKSFREKLKEQKEKHAIEFLKQLEQNGIRGSSIIANLQNDTQWKSLHEQLLSDFRKELRDS